MKALFKFFSQLLKFDKTTKVNDNYGLKDIKNQLYDIERFFLQKNINILNSERKEINNFLINIRQNAVLTKTERANEFQIEVFNHFYDTYFERCKEMDIYSYNGLISHDFDESFKRYSATEFRLFGGDDFTAYLSSPFQNLIKYTSEISTYPKHFRLELHDNRTDLIAVIEIMKDISISNPDNFINLCSSSIHSFATSNSCKSNLRSYQ